ncbi:MAG: Rrf2 family transcriptional regulator [Candidatus Cloacimonetes bacterium]|nr:Rrf2 family transcriptional regulator [Candidatus Cloacimonadota bacterium]
MQISTKTEYAVRALAELSKSSDGKPMSIATICKNQSLPLKYTEQIFRKLKQNELVESIHGSQGGYVLKKPISEITLKNILDSVEDNKAICDCASIDFCPGNPCGLQSIWNEIQGHLDSYFESIKLERMILSL